MKISNFLQSLLPTLTKDGIEEDIRITMSELKDHTLPSYNDAAKFLSKYEFKHPDIVNRIGIFNRMVKHPSNENFIVTIDKGLKDVIENLHKITEIIDKTFNEELTAAGLTYKKANIIQFVECTSFVSKYARKYLSYVYACETSMLDQGQPVEETLPPVEVEWLKANFLSFCTAFNIASGKPQMIEKQLEDIPEIVITNDNVHTLPATLGNAKIDPFGMGIIPVFLNPVYHIGMMVAEWQGERYKAAKEEARVLQFRKMNLEKLAEGKPDARIQKEIDTIQSRIDGLNGKIAKMEAN